MLKRGLSDIIATVLIVLLALASVAIVWGFVSPTIRNAGENVDISSRCLETEFKVTQCNIAGSGPYQVTSTVQLIKGSAAKAQVSYENKNGEIVTTEISGTDVPTEVYASVISDPLTFDSTDFPLEARVAAIVINSEGDEQLCQPISVATICSIGGGTAQNPPGAVCGDGSCDAGENLGNCPADCQIQNPDVCGDGSVTGTEQCDPGVAITETCQDTIGIGGNINPTCDPNTCQYDFTICSTCAATNDCSDYLDSASCNADACEIGGCDWDILNSVCDGGLVPFACEDYTNQFECTSNGCSWNAASFPNCQ